MRPSACLWDIFKEVLVKKGLITYHIPWVGKEGPQSHEKEHCSLRIKLTWHWPFCTAEGQTGGIGY